MSERDLDKALHPLDHLPGLNEIKQQVREFVIMERMQMKRRLASLPVLEGHSRHMIFSGNPGTGKTTVARIIAKIFFELGILHKGEVKEVDRSDLVGAYIGHTEKQTRKMLEEAHGGILFIDEAYALDRGYHWDFGQEAIATIIKYMEDHRDNLIVIAAGYPVEMKNFIKMNPGLESRFSTHIHFEDMSYDVLKQIFKNLVHDNGYLIGSDALDLVKKEIHKLIKFAPNNFANARAVRNLFERTIRAQALRLHKTKRITKKALRQILAEDIPTEELKTDGNVTFLKKT
jgi:stage V sporulation protein K